MDAANAVRYVALPDREDDHRRRRTHERRARAPVTRRSAARSGFRSSRSTARPRGSLATARRSCSRTWERNQAQTRFAVLSTKTLRLKKAITLPGLWAYDALSPNGRTLYATQYFGTAANARYNVRSVSLVTGKPVGGALVDRREPDEEMNGSPYARTRSANGAWAYTLYAKPNGTGFVHALDTARRRAFCVDLPWRTTFQRIAAVRLSLADGGRTLELAKPGGNRLAVVNTTTFKVTAYAKP